jgi:hypothetical protein
MLVGCEKRVTGLVEVELLVPDGLDVVGDVRRAVTARSVDRELHVEAHVGLTAGMTSVVVQREVERRGLVAAEVGLAVVEAEDALDFLGPGDPVSNVVNLGSEVVFPTDASRVLITGEAVGLEGGMTRR